MNSFILPAAQAVPTLLIAFKDIFKAQLIKYLADEIPFKHQIITEREINIFDFLEKNTPDYLLIEDNFLNFGAIGFLKKLKTNKPPVKVIIHAENINANYLKNVSFITCGWVH